MKELFTATFEVCGTMAELKALSGFLKSNNITYKKFINHGRNEHSGENRKEAVYKQLLEFPNTQKFLDDNLKEKRGEFVSNLIAMCDGDRNPWPNATRNP